MNDALFHAVSDFILAFGKGKLAKQQCLDKIGQALDLFAGDVQSDEDVDDTAEASAVGKNGLPVSSFGARNAKTAKAFAQSQGKALESVRVHSLFPQKTQLDKEIDGGLQKHHQKFAERLTGRKVSSVKAEQSPNVQAFAKSLLFGGRGTEIPLLTNLYKGTNEMTTQILETRSKIDAELRNAETAYTDLVRQVANGDKAETGDTLATIRNAGKTTEQFWQDVEDASATVADQKALAEGQRIQREVVPQAGSLIQKAVRCREQIELLVRFIQEGPLAEAQRQESDVLNYAASVNGEWVLLTTRPNIAVVPNYRRSIKALKSEIETAFHSKVHAEVGGESVIDSMTAAAKEKLARLETAGPQFRTTANLPEPPEVKDVLAGFIGPIIAALRQVQTPTPESIRAMVAEQLSKRLAKGSSSV